MNSRSKSDNRRGMISGIVTMVILIVLLVLGVRVTESEFLPIVQRIVGIGGLVIFVVIAFAVLIAKFGDK